MLRNPATRRLAVTGVGLLGAVITCCSNESAPLVGLWDYTPGDVHYDAALVGRLIIDLPCVYVEAREGPDGRLDPDGDPVRRTLVGLPRDYTQYDSETNSLQVFDSKPVTHGDWVIGGGGGSLAGYGRDVGDEELRKYFDSCTANGSFAASSLSPARKRGSAGGWMVDNRP